MLQSATIQDGGDSKSTSRFTRLFAYNVGNPVVKPRLVGEWVVPLPQSSRGNTQACSEIHFVSPGVFWRSRGTEMGEAAVMISLVISEPFVFIKTSRSSPRIDKPICFRLRVRLISMVASSITPKILLQSEVFWMAVLPRRNMFLSLTILIRSS